MTVLFINLVAKFIRWTLWLAIIGELSAQTFVVQKKAGESLQKGLICLKCVNEQLHQGKVPVLSKVSQK